MPFMVPLVALRERFHGSPRGSMNVYFIPALPSAFPLCSRNNNTVCLTQSAADGTWFYLLLVVNMCARTLEFLMTLAIFPGVDGCVCDKPMLTFSCAAILLC